MPRFWLTGLPKEDAWVIAIGQMVAMENPTCIARLGQFKVVAIATIYNIWMKLRSNEVAQLDISAKWLERVEVCASPSTERVQLWWRYLM